MMAESFIFFSFNFLWPWYIYMLYDNVRVTMSMATKQQIETRKSDQNVA